jgi:hypothetical protein
VTSNAQVDAKANGTVRVTLRAYTLDGRQPIGAPFPIDVQATQAGTIGWLIAIAAGIVLVGTTVLRIRQVGRERAAQEHEPEPLQVSRPVDQADTGDTTRDTLDV